MSSSVLRVRMERLAAIIIRQMREEDITPAATTWAQYRERFFLRYWQSGYSIYYLTRLAHMGVEDYVLRHYEHTKAEGPPAG